jgi:hypothetical protein
LINENFELLLLINSNANPDIFKIIKLDEAYIKYQDSNNLIELKISNLIHLI